MKCRLVQCSNYNDASLCCYSQGMGRGRIEMGGRELRGTMITDVRRFFAEIECETGVDYLAESQPPPPPETTKDEETKANEPEPRSCVIM